MNWSALVEYSRQVALELQTSAVEEHLAWVAQAWVAGEHLALDVQVVSTLRHNEGQSQEGLQKS